MDLVPLLTPAVLEVPVAHVAEIFVTVLLPQQSLLQLDLADVRTSPRLDMALNAALAAVLPLRLDAFPDTAADGCAAGNSAGFEFRVWRIATSDGTLVALCTGPQSSASRLLSVGRPQQCGGARWR